MLLDRAAKSVGLCGASGVEVTNAPDVGGRRSSVRCNLEKTGELSSTLIHIPVGMLLDSLKALPILNMANHRKYRANQVNSVRWTLISIPMSMLLDTERQGRSSPLRLSHSSQAVAAKTLKVHRQPFAEGSHVSRTASRPEPCMNALDLEAITHAKCRSPRVLRLPFHLSEHIGATTFTEVVANATQ